MCHVPLSLNQCTYCKTKHARGNLQSYPPEMLLERVRSVVAEGVVEIWLTSEDTGTYGRDIGTDLPTLLWQMVELLPEGVMLRLGMTNPPYIMDHLEEMARVLAHPRVYSFLHIPVQAGSDAVLAAMRRDYTADDFCRAVDHLQRAVPGITIATDLICGFPGETDEDFADTMALVRRYRFPVLHTNQFFPRPGTPAAAMPRVPTKTVKQRTKEVSDFFRSYHPYEHKVGQRQRILVTETATDGQHYIGHNKFYEQVSRGGRGGGGEENQLDAWDGNGWIDTLVCMCRCWCRCGTSSWARRLMSSLRGRESSFW